MQFNYFYVAHTTFNRFLSSSGIFLYFFIYLFICLRELSHCHVIHGEAWFPVSGRVSHFARGVESFNFIIIPCFLVFKASRSASYNLNLASLQVTKPVYFVDSLSGVFTQTGTRELFSCMCLVHFVQESFYFYKPAFIVFWHQYRCPTPLLRCCSLTKARSSMPLGGIVGTKISIKNL